MNEFYHKWLDIQRIAIDAFEKCRPKKLYGCRKPEEGIALVTPIKDFFQEHGGKGIKKFGPSAKSNWKDIWGEFESRAKRVDENKASFFELVDQFHFLIEDDGPPRLIVGDMYSHAIHREGRYLTQDSLCPITYQGSDIIPKEIKFVFRGPPVLTIDLSFKCLSAGEVLDSKDERNNNLIYHAGYINRAEKDRDRDKTRIRFHMRTPVDEEFNGLLTEDYKWLIVENMQDRIDLDYLFAGEESETK